MIEKQKWGTSSVSSVKGEEMAVFVPSKPPTYAKAIVVIGGEAPNKKVNVAVLVKYVGAFCAGPPFFLPFFLDWGRRLNEPK